MKLKLQLVIAFLCFHLGIAQNPITNSADWTVNNITADNELDYPNTIVYGPDGYLWITERIGKKIVKVSPTDGINSKSVILNLTSIVHQSEGQDGLMGIAIHPSLYSDLTMSNPTRHVFIAYTYDNDPGSGLERKLRIARYTYNPSTGDLDSGSAVTVIEDLDASNDHNSGKLQIGPDMKLYYTAGDNGANQFGNRCKPIRAQLLPTQADINNQNYYTYQGKLLRLNLDGSIPSNNPTFNGVQSHLYTVGHRNPQGIIFGSNGKLYSSEHGPNTDDEINIIESGKNYGWPEIAGYYDDMAYRYCNTSAIAGCNTGTSCNNGSGVPESTSGMPVNFQEPIGTYNSTTAIQPNGDWLTWPTIGPSSINIYEAGLIPDWGTSLLIPALKKGTIYRAKLNATGDALVPVNGGSQYYEEFHSSNDRYRDVVLDPDGITMYAITDNTGGTSGPSGSSQVSIENPGVIVKIKFTGETLNTETVNLQNSFSLFPNPTINHFKIKFNETTFNSVNIKIIDLQGRIVNQINTISNNDAIRTTDLSNGLYFIKIFDKNHNEIASKKLIKK
ncbi:PQQ-dependent sugar dehydrogenase [Lacinutrix himadriensis]|uniref:PQQ-dependent sugar dehydrogenase n=1 Tax=Lacinutrix himadriensis TaxID=641549 RepID=UPI0006E14430|nr:PQQ-dependent sugar dehydrogenase [Lacinutrix himadriensis]